MKKILSLIIVFSLFLSSCSTLTDLTSGAIDDAAKATGVSKIGGATGTVKKAAIPKKKEWGDGDKSIREDVVNNVPKTNAYLDGMLGNLASYAKVNKDEFRIFVVRTALVQGMASWGGYAIYTEIKITRGMFNMIYDEAELASLIGHEIGHYVLHRQREKEKPLMSKSDKTKAAGSVTDVVLDGSKYKGIVKKQQNEILTTNWNREEEKAADKYGAELAAKAGYDPYAFCDLFERLAGRVDLGLMYRLQKIDGSHPALDDRAKSLREYLKKKGYKEGEGKRNRQEYLDGMSEIFAIRTGEGGKENKKIQKEIDEEGKRDLKRLDEIIEEIDRLQDAKQVSIEKIFDILDETIKICQKYDIDVQEIIKKRSSNQNSFMEETIVQDEPFTDLFAYIRDKIIEKVSKIVDAFDRFIHKVPYVADIIGFYEAAVGRNVITGNELSFYERVINIAFAFLGTAGPIKNTSKELIKIFEKRGVKDAEKMIGQAVSKVETNYVKNAGQTQAVTKLQGKEKAADMVTYLNAHNGSTPKNISGKGVYKNKDNLLPKADKDVYLKYDLAVPGPSGRDTERIVVNTQTGEVWYTANHYESFEKLDIIFNPKKK
ncbi:MAG: M48 family metalloprotease [Endomicrobia bacterium]|nr:M48 family metalloprotease [Endomicrobiia bacterium]